MPLFGAHRAFEIPGTPGFNPEAEDPRMRRRSIYAFPQTLPRVSRDGSAPGTPGFNPQAEDPRLRRRSVYSFPEEGTVEGVVGIPPQAPSPTLDRVLGVEDKYPLLTERKQHIASEPTYEQYRPSKKRFALGAVLGGVQSFLHPGEGVGAETMTNIMEAPYRKAHGKWERQARMMQASHEMNKVRRDWEQADAEERRKQGHYKLDMQIKGKLLEGKLTPQEAAEQRAELFDKHYPKDNAATRGQFALTGKFPPAQRPSTAGIGRTVVVDGRVKQFNEVTGRFDIDLGKAPQRPSARQLSDEREVDVVKSARGALENANGDAQTAIEDVGWLVDQGLIPAELYDNIIQSIRLQVRPIPGQEGTGFSSEFGLGR